MAGTGEICGAKKRQGEGYCQKQAGWGTESLGVPGARCRLHGGATRTHRAGATMTRARFEAGQLGGPMVDLEPHDALVIAFQIKAAQVDFYAGKIAELRADEIAGHPRSVKRRAGHDNDGHAAATVEEQDHRPELSLWIRAHDAAVKDMAAFAKQAADAGVDERRLRLHERYAEPLAAVVNAVMMGLVAAGMPESFLPIARDLFVQHAELLDEPAVTSTAELVA
ncbi:MAG: hypothetical protein JWM93_2649 [Frankiales bacterium]|nr:hypothetical protein [Frankiales bacterium]